MEVNFHASNMIRGSWSVIHGAIWEHDLLGSHFTVDLLRFGYISPTSQKNLPHWKRFILVLGHVPLPSSKKNPYHFCPPKKRAAPCRSGVAFAGSCLYQLWGALWESPMVVTLGCWVSWDDGIGILCCWFTLKKIWFRRNLARRQNFWKHE